MFNVVMGEGEVGYMRMDVGSGKGRFGREYGIDEMEVDIGIRRKKVIDFICNKRG